MFRTFGQKPQDAGKPAKAALPATATRLPAMRNSMIAGGTCLREDQPA